MPGINEIIVALWLLPVVLFICIPLTLTAIWVVISPIIALFRLVTGQAEEQQYLQSANTA